MRDSMATGKRFALIPAWLRPLVLRSGRPARRRGRTARRLTLAASASLGLSFLPLVTGATSASAATPLNVFVGYMDTHTVGFSTNQPNPWPYTDPSSYDGSPCPSYPNDTTCWDASAVRLDNPGSTDVTGVHVVVDIGSSVYDLWASNLTVKAHGMLVLTETGGQNSTNFDGSDYPPNAYNGGNQASCANSGAIPDVKITIAGTTTTYLDNGQVLNGGGVDSGHCLNGTFVSGRMDESHPWVQIGSAAPTAPTRAAVAGRHGGQRLGGPDLVGADLERRLGDHRVQHLPRHEPGGESGTPVASNVTGGQLHRHRPDERHHVLLHGRGGQQRRRLRAVQRDLRDADPGAGDRAVGAAGADRDRRQLVGEAVVDGPGVERRRRRSPGTTSTAARRRAVSQARRWPAT